MRIVPVAGATWLSTKPLRPAAAGRGGRCGVAAATRTAVAEGAVAMPRTERREVLAILKEVAGPESAGRQFAGDLRAHPGGGDGLGRPRHADVARHRLLLDDGR